MAPSADPPLDVATYRTPLGQRLLSAAGVAILAPLALGMTAVGLALATRPPWPVAVVVLGCALVLVALLLYVYRDAAGKWGLSIRLDGQGVRLDLPRSRSLIHRLQPVHERLPYADIEALETRLEAYSSLGFQAMQRVYALRRRGGSVIILGEDRALGTDFAQEGLGGIFATLKDRTGAPLIDRGMVEGRGGLLLVVGASPDAWQAPSLTAARQAVLWQRAAATGALPVALLLVAWALKAVFGY